MKKAINHDLVKNVFIKLAEGQCISLEELKSGLNENREDLWWSSSQEIPTNSN